MVNIKKYRHKPVYKNFTNLQTNIQYNQKFLKFKKIKWKNLLFKLKLQSKFKKRNCYYKFYDQNSYYVSKFSNYFSKEYKQSITKKKSLKLFYGTLNEKYLKDLVNKSIKESNKLNNQINSKTIFSSLLSQRLDTVLLKSNFVLTARNARQLITHKHVLVNGVVVKDNSFLIKTGDKITFEKKVHNLVKYYILKSSMWPLPLKNLQINYTTLQIRVVEEFIMARTGDVLVDLNNIIKAYKK